MHRSFDEYLNAKGVLEKPKEKLVADYDGPKGVEDKAAKKNCCKMKGLKEYLDEKGKIVEPKVELVADYKGPNPVSPDQGDSKAKPYKAVTGNESSAKGECGLGDKGDKNLIYEPDTKVEGKNTAIPGGKTLTKTESFLEKTRGLSLDEFTDYMIKECCTDMDGGELPTVTAYTTGKFHPFPPEAIKYITALSGKNGGIMESLVNEMKRQKLAGALVKTLMDHPEIYDEITSLLGDSEEGPKRSQALARSMNGHYNKFLDEQAALYESVGPPMGMSIDDEDDDEDEEDHDGSELTDEPEDAENDDQGEDDEFEPSDDSEPMDGEETPESPKEKKLKKRFAHHNVIDAMKDHEPMRDYMSGY